MALPGRSRLKRPAGRRREAEPSEPAPLTDRLSGQGKAEETCLDKTPKRELNSRSYLHAFRSPANETDLQLEIFWDPHSPLALKLGHKRKMQKARGSTVEISKVVNQITPQDDKPSCYEESLVGLWTGEGAIPRTPAAATKGNGARGHQLQNREKQLVKFAKHLDNNQIDANQDQDASCHNLVHVESEAERLIKYQDDVQVQNLQQLHEVCPQTGTALSLGPLKESIETVQHRESSSQKSLDQDAEDAFNALFDCSTQKCSGWLSLSGSSTHDCFHENQSILLQEEHTLGKSTDVCGPLVLHRHTQSGSVPALECMEPVPAERADMVTLQQPIPSTDFSKAGSVVSNKLVDLDDWDADLLDSSTQKCSGRLSFSDSSLHDSFHESQSILLQDGHTLGKSTDAYEHPLPQSGSVLALQGMGPVLVDLDDWDADLLSDDSFAIPSTQNPELIRTPGNALHPTSNKTERTLHSNRSQNGDQCSSLKWSEVPVAHSLEKPSHAIRKAKASVLHADCHLNANKINSVLQSSQNNISGCNSTSVKSENRCMQKHFTQLKYATGTGWPEKRAASHSEHTHLPRPQTGKCRSNMPSINDGKSTISANSKLKEVAGQASIGHLKQVEQPKKQVSSFDDCSELMLSDDVLDLFCDSDSLLDANCDDADDDLLYQACDSVEKSTWGQDVEKVKLVVETGCTSKCVDPCLTIPKQECFYRPPAQNSCISRKTFSLDAPCAPPSRKTFSLDAPCAPPSRKTFSLDAPYSHPSRKTFSLDAPHSHPSRKTFSLDAPHSHPSRKTFSLDAPFSHPSRKTFSLDAPYSHPSRETFSLDAPCTLPTVVKNESTVKIQIINSVPKKWCSSSSVLEGGVISGNSSDTMPKPRLNSYNSGKGQNVLCNVGKLQNDNWLAQMSTEESKYIFQKAYPSQAVVLGPKSINAGSLSEDQLCWGKTKDLPNVQLHTSVQMNPNPSFKRHLSDSLSESGTEQKSRRYSQEEIARKKQEALERRKCKMQQGSLKNTMLT